MGQSQLSITHSVFLGEALLENVLCYPISKPLSCRLHKQGLNDTYLVETEQEKYILRVYRSGWRTKAEIDFELELLAFLHEQNMPVSYPIEQEQGGFVEAIAAPEGKRYTALFSYAPGWAVSNQLDGKQSRRLGEVLASIHQTLDQFHSSFSRPALSSEYLLDRSMDTIKPLFRHRGSDVDYLQKQIEEIKRQLEDLGLPKQAPAYGICVGDVHSENVHFTEWNEPTLFDFDQCGHGWQAFDIGKFVHKAYTWKIDSGIVRLFLDGYQAIRKLGKDELASIPIFVKAAHIWVMGIATSVVGDVLPYSWFTNQWLDGQLAVLKSLDNDDGALVNL